MSAAMEKHYQWAGKIETKIRCEVGDRADLAVAYTPGVAEPCLAIRDDYNKSWELTRRWNTVAVVTDGTAVLGLGDIGPEAGMPVMEGKCVLFKRFGGVDAIPVCLRTKDTDEIVRTVYLMSGSFGGINLEDISAPRCFEIERRLKELCDIPVFHDDQHGTAVVTVAGVINAAKLTGRSIPGMRVVISGAGAAGVAVAKLLMTLGVRDIILSGRDGLICDGVENLPPHRIEIAKITNPRRISGSLANGFIGADVFIGVSAPGIVTAEMVKTMNGDPIVFAMANPVPEITPDEARRGGAAVIGTGRSDFPNQINNVLAFPGIFRGAFDCRARDINERMNLAAAYALAGLVGEGALSPDRIIPDPFDPEVPAAVAEAVKRAAKESGAARL